MAPVPTADARLTVPAAEPAAALDAVRFAVSADPELPMLGGVLFDTGSEELRVVATDRYRVAVARAGATEYEGDGARVLVPASLADAMRALLSDAASARLVVDGHQVALEAGDRRTAGCCPDHEFPDYRRLVRLPEGRRVTVDVPPCRRRCGPAPSARTRCASRTVWPSTSAFRW